MSARSRTLRTRGRRPRVRRHHADRAFRTTTVFDLTAEEVMLDLDPAWSVRTRGAGGTS